MPYGRVGDPGFKGSDGCFLVLDETSASGEPYQGKFRDPASGRDDELARANYVQYASYPAAVK